MWRGLWTSGSLTTDELTYWSVSGQKLGTYSITVNTGSGSTAPSFTLTQTGTNYYFGRKLIKNAGGYVGADRLGSVGHYYPYGQEKPSATTKGTEKFTGYFRDAETGLDYADQRFHNPGAGRFLTPDPYQARGTGAADPRNPGSWNRYAYVQGDPVNFRDPSGLLLAGIGDPGTGCVIIDDVESIDCDDGGGGAGGGGGSGPPPPPAPKLKCWQNVPNIMATLQNLGTDIELDAAQGGFSPAGLTTLTNDIDEDIASELNDIGLGGTTAAPYYIGGHFNLDIPILQLIIPGAFSQADVDKFDELFAGAGLASDGVRQPAVTGQALALGYFLHSQEGKPKDPSNYSFHFDRFDYGVVHGVYDGLGGHLGHPCLDPAWH